MQKIDFQCAHTLEYIFLVCLTVNYMVFTFKCPKYKEMSAQPLICKYGLTYNSCVFALWESWTLWATDNLVNPWIIKDGGFGRFSIETLTQQREENVQNEHFTACSNTTYSTCRMRIWESGAKIWYEGLFEYYVEYSVLLFTFCSTVWIFCLALN